MLIETGHGWEIVVWQNPLGDDCLSWEWVVRVDGELWASGAVDSFDLACWIARTVVKHMPEWKE